MSTSGAFRAPLIAPAPSQRRSRLVVAVAAATVTACTLSGFVAWRKGGRGHPAAAQLTSSLDMTCLRDTGGTCRWLWCSGFRGTTSCENSRCVCNDSCSGADGVCYHKHNRVVASGVRLETASNATEDDGKFMFVPANRANQDSLKLHTVHDSAHTPADRFTIYRLPGSLGISAPQNAVPNYIVASESQPGFAVQLGSSQVTGEARPVDGAYLTASVVNAGQQTVPNLALKISTSVHDPGKVMIGSYSDQSGPLLWADGPHEDTVGYDPSVGAKGCVPLQGLWQPTPPLAEWRNFTSSGPFLCPDT